jgi:hypothetical protein
MDGPCVPAGLIWIGIRFGSGFDLGIASGMSGLQRERGFTGDRRCRVSARSPVGVPGGTRISICTDDVKCRQQVKRSSYKLEVLELYVSIRGVACLNG